MKTYADKRRRAANHEFVIGDKVLVNQLHNKKVFNKIKSTGQNKQFINRIHVQQEFQDQLKDILQNLQVVLEIDNLKGDKILLKTYLLK